MQAYWANPKSWLLDEFIINGEMITVKVRNGNSLTAPIKELKVRSQTDKYDRSECIIRHHEEKLHFKEIPGMLKDDEWNELFDILDTIPDTDQTKAAWFVTIMSKIIDIFS